MAASGSLTAAACSPDPGQQDPPPQAIIIVEEDDGGQPVEDMASPVEEDMPAPEGDMAQLAEDMNPPEEDMAAPVDMGPPLPLITAFNPLSWNRSRSATALAQPLIRKGWLSTQSFPNVSERCAHPAVGNMISMNASRRRS